MFNSVSSHVWMMVFTVAGAIFAFTAPASTDSAAVWLFVGGITFCVCFGFVFCSLIDFIGFQNTIVIRPTPEEMAQLKKAAAEHKDMDIAVVLKPKTPENIQETTDADKDV